MHLPPARSCMRGVQCATLRNPTIARAIYSENFRLSSSYAAKLPSRGRFQSHHTSTHILAYNSILGYICCCIQHPHAKSLYGLGEHLLSITFNTNQSLRNYLGVGSSGNCKRICLARAKKARDQAFKLDRYRSCI